jgi:type VI secretion system protein ImpD
MESSLALADGNDTAPSPPVLETPEQHARITPEPAPARPDTRRAEVLARIQALIAEIDRRLGRQLDAILHHPEFQRLEGLWRGVHWLASGITDSHVKLRILDVRWTEIARDLERALDFDQSTLFDLVYSQEFGMPGGEPYGLMLVDRQVAHVFSASSKIDDIEVLEGLSDIAAAAFCPFIFSADPRLLALDGFDEIDIRQDLATSFMDLAFARWNRMRARTDSRFVGVVMPRLLGRTLHRGRDHPRLGFVYDEAAESSRDLLWISGGFGLGHVAARAMMHYRWPAAIRGTLPRGEAGTIDGPVRQMLGSDEAGFVARFAVENAVSEQQEVVLNDAGVIALRQMHLTGMTAFLNLPSLHRPPTYDGEAARMNAKMSAMLNYILCVSRFAHYLKVMARDWVGKYQTAEQCQRLLQEWLGQYITGNDDATPEHRVRYPLRDGRVTVTEIPEKPGSFGCEIHLRPHYQLDQITSEFRLTTAIASGRS